MKIKIILFFLLLVSSSAKSDILVTFDLEYCIDSASHIFRAKILNEKGLLEINQVYYGKTKLKNITLPDLADIKKLHSKYGPSDEFPDWEIMVFLKEMNLSTQTFVPAFNLAKSSFDLAVSIFWIKDDKVYYASESYDSRRIVFGGGRTLLEKEKIMNDLIEIKIGINKIKKKKRCKKRIKLFSKLFDNHNANYKIYEAMMETDCGKELLPFLEVHLPTDSFQWIHSQIIKDYIKFGKEKKKAKIEAMFESEFDYWKNHIQKNSGKQWWHGSKNENRYLYFSNLVYALVVNEVGDWRAYSQLINNTFTNLELYQKVKKEMAINRRIQHAIEQKESK